MMGQRNILNTDTQGTSQEKAGSKTKPCIFCKIINGEAKGYTVFEDEISVAILDYRPLLHGHVLLVPKQHYETFIDLPKDFVGPLFENVQLLARVIEKSLAAGGTFVGINNRISQSVPHLHIHIVPRRKDDKLFTQDFSWRRQPYTDEEALLQMQETIKSAVEGNRSPIDGGYGAQ
jgi:histidine triad (HIT) family protein